jgi:hypothetical protein
MKTNILTLVAITTLFFVSCTEKIELDLFETEVRTVIEATITNKGAGHRVIVSQTAGYLSDEPSPRISDARVELFDGEQTWLFVEDVSGEYVPAESFSGEPGRLYELLVDTGEDMYRAQSLMHEPVEMDSLWVLPHPWIPDHHNLIVHFNDPAKSINYYMWNVYRNGDLLTDSLRKVPFTDGEVFSGMYVSAPVYIFQPEDGIPQSGDEVVAEMFSIPKEYFDFLTAVRRNQGSAGGPFVGPPSNIPSNFDNNALGFFVAKAVSEQKLVIE